MEDKKKRFVENALSVAVSLGVFGTIAGVFLKCSKVDREREQERIRNAKERNKEIENDIKSKKEFNTTELISEVLSSNNIKSNIKSKLIKSIKCGRNTLKDVDNKQLFIVANNDLINDDDKCSIFEQICDGHVKTKEELESETRISEAYYKYCTEKIKEETKIKQFQIEQENSLKKTKVFNETARSIFTNKNDTNTKETTY